MHTLVSLSFYAVGVTSEEEVLCFREKVEFLILFDQDRTWNNWNKKELIIWETYTRPSCYI